MHTQSYKARTLDVRRSARAQLLELRQARRQRRAFLEQQAAQVEAVTQIADVHVDESSTAEHALAADLPNGDALEDFATKSVTEPNTEVTPQVAPDTPKYLEAEADWQSSPLAALPGAGPGLIWLLEQCGVATMEDLARQNATDLAANLGVVGQILNVEKWIDLAQEAT